MKHLTKDELRKLLEVAKSHSERNWLIILTTYRHGLRASEIVGPGPVIRTVRGKTLEMWPLRGEDIQDGEMVIRRLKGSNKTTHPLAISADPLFNEKAALEKLAAENPGILFPITRQMFWHFFQQYCKEAGIAKSKAHPHVCKHSIAHHAIKDAGIQMMRQYLGHKSIASTGMYLIEDDETASKAIAAAVGL